MKRLFTLLAIMTLSIATLIAQTPDLINYQAVARDGNGDIMANQSINVSFIIHSGSAAGPVEFEEDHTSINTNDFGLFSLQIGSGSNVSGSIDGIGWGADSYWLEVAVNGSSVGTQQLVSVPYALEAGAPWVRDGSDLVYTEGNVGIGVSSPTSTLDISSSNAVRTLNIVNTSTAGIGQLINIERTETPLAFNDFFQLKVPTGSPDNFQFMECERGSSIEFSIQGDGSVGIHTGSTSADLHIKQSQNTIGSGTGGVLFEAATATDAWRVYHSAIHLSFDENGVRRAYVEGGTGDWTQPSDRSLKENIEPLGEVLTGVLQLAPARYNYITGDVNEKKTLGFIAQDVQNVFPEIVHTSEDGALALGYKDFGILAIKAIQEQQTQMEAMQAELEALKQELEELKK